MCKGLPRPLGGMPFDLYQKWAEDTAERDKDYEKRLAKWLGNEDCYAKTKKIQRLIKKKRRR